MPRGHRQNLSVSLTAPFSKEILARKKVQVALSILPGVNRLMDGDGDEQAIKAGC
jgi:hypothetical protein